MKLLVATRSEHKMFEIRKILHEVPGLVLLDLEAVGIEPSLAEEDLEPYDSFDENARGASLVPVPGFRHCMQCIDSS